MFAKFVRKLREKCCKLKKGRLIASIKSNSCNSLSNLFPSTADSRQEQSPTNQEIHCRIRLHSHPPGVGEWRYQLRKSIIRVCLDAFKANFARTMHGVEFNSSEVLHRKVRSSSKSALFLPETPFQQNFCLPPSCFNSSDSRMFSTSCFAKLNADNKVCCLHKIFQLHCY